MAKSYTTGRNLYGTWTHNTSSANLLVGDQVANDTYRRICALKTWPFLERQRFLYTQANVQTLPLPYDTDKVQAIGIQVGNLTYTPLEVKDVQEWQRLNLVKYTSDYTRYYFIMNGQISFWPWFATTGNLITLTVKVRVVDLSRPDYTTGSVQSVQNGSQTVTFQGTTLTNIMVGRYVQITPDDSTTSGDGTWYEIGGVVDTTHATLVRAYGGPTISAATQGFTIGQMPLLPSDFHDLPWLRATWKYWSKESDPRAAEFKTDYTDGMTALIDSYSATSDEMVLDWGEDVEIINPNLTININNQTN